MQQNKIINVKSKYLQQVTSLGIILKTQTKINQLVKPKSVTESNHNKGRKIIFFSWNQKHLKRSKKDQKADKF